MVKDHSDSERGNPLPPHGILFPINRRGSLIAPSHRQDSTYHSLCYTSHGTRNSSMGLFNETRQYNIQFLYIKLSFSSIGKDKSKLQNANHTEF